MATKKLTPVKTEPTDTAELADQMHALADSMDSMSKYLHSIDWKLWMLMNMVRLIGEENGYKFSVLDKANNGSEQSKDYGDE
jgi:hypothetical protein